MQHEFKKAFFTNATKTLEDTLAAAPHALFKHLISLYNEENQGVLNKPHVLNSIVHTFGPIDDANMRKRISLINKALKQNQLGIEIDNTKAAIIIKLEETALDKFIEQIAVEQIQKNNKAQYPDENRIVPQHATSGEPPKRQVMMSYAWETANEQLHHLQNMFIARLKDKLANPPVPYTHAPKIYLFWDKHDFKLGEPQTQSQDHACQQSQAAVILYTHKYMHSNACQKELNYFLTEDGSNLPNKKAFVIPFSITYSDLPTQLRKNLAHTAPSQNKTALDLMEQGSTQDQEDYITTLVKAIYEHFEHSTPPTPKKNTIQDMLERTAQFQCYLDDSKHETLHADASPNFSSSNSFALVPFLTDWAIQTDSNAPRVTFLLGDFGAGKSTACQLLTKRMTEQYTKTKDEHSQRAVLPIYLDLKRLLNAFADQNNILTLPLERLIAQMLEQAGETQTDGKAVIHYVQHNPCLLIFDGFDEIGHKLSEEQQKGILSKLIEIFPKETYQQDLQRMRGEQLAHTHNVPINSRILITCRTHFFSTYEKEQAFCQLSYRHDVSETIGEIKNFACYYLCPFTKEQINHYLTNWLGQEEGQKASAFIDTVHDLTGLAQRPVMLQLIRTLLPDLVKRANAQQTINAATLYESLFNRVIERDGEKHLISSSEKFKLLADFALKLWHTRSTCLNAKTLTDWFKTHYTHYPQIKIDIETRHWSFDMLLQDLHNASLLVRNSTNDYQFAHTSFYEFFLACGIFYRVLYGQNNMQLHGLDQLTHGQEDLQLNQETIQFIIDWRQTTPPDEQKTFDAHWQQLTQQPASLTARQLGFNIWYAAYATQQPFAPLLKPNWENLTLNNQEFRHPINLSGANLSNITMQRTFWQHCQFKGCHWQGARLVQSHFDHCDINQALSLPLFSQSSRFWQCHTDTAWRTNTLATTNNFYMPTPLANTPPTALLQAPATSDCKWIDAIAFSPDGQSIAFGGAGGAFLYTGNSHTLTTLPYSNYIGALAFSPDGQSIALGELTGTLHLHHLGSKTLSTLVKGLNLITSIAFNPDGQSIALLANNTLYVYHLGNKTLSTLVKNLNSITSIAFNPDGQSIALLAENSVSMYHLGSKTQSTLVKSINRIKSISFHPDGQSIVLLTNNMVYAYHLGSKTQDTLIDGLNNIASIAFSPDGQSIALGAYDGILYLYNLNNHTLHALTQQPQRIHSLTFNADGQGITAVAGHTVVRYHPNHQTLTTHVQLSAPPSAASFSPDGQSFAFIRNDMMYLYHLNNKSLTTLATCPSPTITNTFSFNGQCIAIAGSDDLHLYHLSSNTLLPTVNMPSSALILSVAFSPNGQCIAIASFEDLYLYDLNSNTLNTLNLFPAPILSITFSPDGQSIALLTHKGTLYLYDLKLQTAKPLVQLPSYFPNLVNKTCITFSANGQFIACTNNAGALYVYHLHQQALHTLIQLPNRIHSIALNPNGQTIACAVGDCILVVDIDSGNILHSMQQLPHTTVFYNGSPYTTVPTRATGEAWRYLTTVTTDEQGQTLRLAPTAHPQWQHIYSKTSAETAITPLT